MSTDWAYVTDDIYISSAEVVDNDNFLREHGIGLIVNASNRPQYVNKISIPTIFAMNFSDTVPGVLTIKKDTIELINKLDDISNVIAVFRRERPRTKILIHCHAGINRSATIIAYYLIKHRNYESADIVNKIRLANTDQRKNTPALINPLFEKIILSMRKKENKIKQ